MRIFLSAGAVGLKTGI